MARDSDRWVTPGVVATGLIVAGLVVLGILGCVAWLVSIGRDPAPVLQAVGASVTAVSSLGAVALQLANRATVAKVERNTGALAYGAREPDTGRLGRHSGRPPVPERPRGRLGS